MYVRVHVAHVTYARVSYAMPEATNRGHSMNQSMVQQLTREGNMRHLALKESPTGLMHSTMCSLSWTRLMKWAKMASLSPSGMPCSFAKGRTCAITCSYSSAANRLGT